MFDYFRIACAVPDVEVADVGFNITEIKKFINKANSDKVDLLVFPELSVTGYTCGDLFFQNALLKEAVEGIKSLVEYTKGKETAVAVGLPLKIEDSLYNCAVVIYDGAIGGIVPKKYIPDHGEFSEKRYFNSSANLNTEYISSVLSFGLSDEYYISVTSGLFLLKGANIGIEICEDLFAPSPVSTGLCLSGAEIIINLAASNETVGKRDKRTNLVVNQSSRGICAYAFCSAGCKESTSGLVFSGHSIISENGKIIAEQKENISSDYMIISDIDLGKIRHDRMINTTFSDCKAYNKTETYRHFVSEKESASDGEFASVDKLPFVPSKEADRIDRCLSVFGIQVAGLKKRLEKTGCKPVIGISGGLDSTLALLVAVEAVKSLGRPVSDVIGITMPCFGTTDRTYNNAVSLMKSLGITNLEINIKEACMQHFEDIGQSSNSYDLTYENSQARERTQVLMDYAGKVGGLVVGTGDMSEMALGWCTYNGDHMSMYGVNSGIPKSLIRWIIDSLIKNGSFANSKAYLEDIVNTPISPELLPPDAKGEIAQQTEDIVGPYALHDFFLYNILRYGLEPEKVYFLAKKAFKNDFDSETVLKWLKTFYRRFFSQQFKRSCMPDGIKIGSVGISPSTDLKMPSDACASIWLKQLDIFK